MRNYKRVLAGVLAVVCLVVFSVSSVFAASSPTSGAVVTTKTGQYYNWTKDTSVTVKYATKSKDVTTDTIVPTVTIKGKVRKVNKIGAKAYNNCKKLTRINIKSPYCYKVNPNAFKGCSKAQLKKLKVIVPQSMPAKKVRALRRALKALGIPSANVKRSSSW